MSKKGMSRGGLKINQRSFDLPRTRSNAWGHRVNICNSSLNNNEYTGGKFKGFKTVKEDDCEADEEEEIVA